MRRSFLCTIVFAAACLLLCAQETRAQYAYGASGIGYDPNTKVVYGYSRTSVDPWAGSYYDPYVEGFLFDPYYLRDWGYSRGYMHYYAALVETAAYTTPSTQYDVISDHYVISWYSVSVTVCDYYGFYGGCGYDPYGFSSYWGGWYGGFNYFYGGYGGYVPERTYYLGTTGISGITPAECEGSSSATTYSMTSEGSSEPAASSSSTSVSNYEGSSSTSRDSVSLSAGEFCPAPFTARIYSTNNSEYIQGSTQKAMLGATIPLRAEASDKQSNDAYEWKVGNTVVGNAQTFSGSIDTLGSHTVSLKITRGNVSRTTSVTVSVEVPELHDAGGSPAFFGDQLEADVAPGVPCINDFFDPFTYLKLGCPRTGFPGMQIDAVIKTVPKVISNRAESKLKFVQLVNTSVKRVNTTTGQCTILTKRGGPPGTQEWLLDASDPYGADENKPAIGTIDSVNQNRGSTVSMDDSPGLKLVDGYNWTLEDKFESYFVYYTGTEAQPKNQKAIGVLEWSWGGATTYNASAQEKHTAVAGSLRPAARNQDIRGRKLTPTNEGTGIRQYDPTRVQDYFKEENFKSCGGGTTTPPGGGTVNGGTFVSQSVPTSVAAGSVFAVAVTMRNSGDTTWTSDVYKLGAQNPHDNSTWGSHRIYLPDGVSVPPGSEYTFNVNVTAPYSAGLYNFQWRMVKEGVEWFGDWTPNVAVSVTSGSSCDWSAENNCYANGGEWDYSTCQCNYYYNPCGGYSYSSSAQMQPCYTY